MPNRPPTPPTAQQDQHAASISERQEAPSGLEKLSAHQDQHQHQHQRQNQRQHQQHSHSHGHSDVAKLSQNGRAFAIAIALNCVFVAVEFFYGYLANSTALMADAGHNLADVLSLVVAWSAVVLARKAPTHQFTYGLGSSTILAALGNAILLLVAAGAIGWEAVQRLFDPPTVHGQTVMVVAGVGIVINSFSAWLFMKGSQSDLNLRAAFLHMAADAAVSVGVVAGGVAIIYSGWNWIDPLISIGIVGVIVWGSWEVLTESMRLALNAVPRGISPQKILDFLRAYPQVSDVHDLHIWAMSTTENALTVHLVMPEGYPGDAVLDDITQSLLQNHGIQHATIQVEQGSTDHACVLHSRP